MGFWNRLRTFFMAGLIVLAPVAVTWYVLAALFRMFDGVLAGPVARLLGRPIPGLGALATIFLILGIGVFTANFIGRAVVRAGESVVLRTPLVRSVYATVKQILDAFVRNDQTTFNKVALVEYPRRGMCSIGFITGETVISRAALAEMQASGNAWGSLANPSGGPALGATPDDGIRVFNVFIATTPNPTSGFLLLVPAEQVTILDMSIEDGMRMVISGGVLASAVNPAPLAGPGSGGDGEPGAR